MKNYPLGENSNEMRKNNPTLVCICVQGYMERKPKRVLSLSLNIQYNQNKDKQPSHGQSLNCKN